MDSATKFCFKCGKAIPEKATFCSFCGAKQVISLEGSQTADKSQAHESVAAVQSLPPLSSKKHRMLMSMKLFFTDAFTVTKRISRADFWWGYLAVTIVSGLLSVLTFGTVLQTPLFGFVFGHFILVSFPKLLLLIIVSGILSLTTISLYSAWIRRLHDTNKSGHFLWLLLLPLIGPIILIVMACQPSNAQGSRFDKPSSGNRWPKKWWSWLWLVLVTIFLVLSLNGIALAGSVGAAASSTAKDASAGETDGGDTDVDASSEAPKKNTIMLSDDRIDLSGQQTYNVHYSNDTWANTTFTIDKVTVYKTDGEYTNGTGSDKQAFNGIIKAHFGIQAGRDISTYPTQATLNTNDGQQVDADLMDSDDFDGDINSQTKADGNVYFLIPKMKSVSDIKTLRLNWDASYETDDYDDDNSDKTFDVTVNLN